MNEDTNYTKKNSNGIVFITRKTSTMNKSMQGDISD
jgi:hypothetical protein